MQTARPVVDHSAAHRDCVPQDFISDAELFERMNAPRRKGQIDGTATDEISFPRVNPAFEQLHGMTTLSQIRSQQAPGESAPDQDKLRCHVFCSARANRLAPAG
jgi:hypothetical protein